MNYKKFIKEKLNEEIGNDTQLHPDSVYRINDRSVLLSFSFGFSYDREYWFQIQQSRAPHRIIFSKDNLEYDELKSLADMWGIGESLELAK